MHTKITVTITNILNIEDFSDQQISMDVTYEDGMPSQVATIAATASLKASLLAMYDHDPKSVERSMRDLAMRLGLIVVDAENCGCARADEDPKPSDACGIIGDHAVPMPAPVPEEQEEIDLDEIPAAQSLDD